MTDARRVAADVAGELLAAGADAVALVGSVARGDALPTSDIDLIAVGNGPGSRLLIRSGRQVSVSWRTEAEVRGGFHRPEDAGGAVPAWRAAHVLADPAGVARRLMDEALAWTTSVVDEAADRWVAEQVTGYAEEVHRLVGQATGGSPRMAAVVRSLLAVRLPMVLAVHRRLLYDSENRLWDLVADTEGPDWTAAQDRAFGETRAALDLYALLARRTEHLLDSEQADVVQQALAVH